MRIEIISGSPRSMSASKRVALHLYDRLKKVEADVGLINRQEYELPFVENVWTGPQNAPDGFQDVARRMFEADAFILVTPEYNGSYSPALRNFLDHFPKQNRKVFGIATASPGSLGGVRAATFESYRNEPNPFPVIEVLPNINTQKQLPARYRYEAHGYDLLYNFSYEFRSDGKVVKRIATQGSTSEVAVYNYY